LNGIKIVKRQVEASLNINCGGEIFEVDTYEETLPNGTKYLAVYRKEGTMVNTDEFIIPSEHYFFLGDNRDCSKDSRFLGSVGYVNFNNLVGKARIIFFSTDKEKGSFFKFWDWNQIVRKDRLFKKI
jgi:signal peptidase I